MPAAERFVPLAAWLCPSPPPAAPQPPPAAPRPDPEPEPAPPPPVPPPAGAAAERELLREVRFFRAHLAEALERATSLLVRDLATAVLGRELRLAPADVAALAARILADHPAAAPIVVRHAPSEPLDLAVPTLADPALAPGDLVVAFADGSIDARLGVRLAVALEAWT